MSIIFAAQSCCRLCCVVRDVHCRRRWWRHPWGATLNMLIVNTMNFSNTDLPCQSLFHNFVISCNYQNITTRFWPSACDEPVKFVFWKFRMQLSWWIQIMARLKQWLKIENNGWSMRHQRQRYKLLLKSINYLAPLVWEHSWIERALSWLGESMIYLLRKEKEKRSFCIWFPGLSEGRVGTEVVSHPPPHNPHLKKRFKIAQWKNNLSKMLSKLCQ